MNLRKKLLVAGLVTLVIGAPLAIAGHEGYGPTARDVVTGHTVFVDAREFDPDIAAIAGIVERKVVWFNGVTIFDTTTKGFVIAVEADSADVNIGNIDWKCDPRDGLDWQFVDQDMTFIDPNGQHHVVTHYTYRCNNGFAPQPLGDLADGTQLEGGLEGTVLQFRNHAWVTYNHGKLDDPTVFDQYNFALAVDTREFNSRDSGDDGHDPAGPCNHTDPAFCHDGTGGDNVDDIKDGDSKNPDTDDHTPDGPNAVYNKDHKHNVAEVDLYFSRSDKGDGQSTGCADEDNPATPDVNETAEGDECRAAIGCNGGVDDPSTPEREVFDPDPTTPAQEPFEPNAPPCTDTADTAP